MDRVFASKTKATIKEKLLSMVSDQSFDEDRFVTEQKIYLQVFKRFNLLRVRMKISFMALQRQMTIKELFLETILDSYHKLNSLGLVRNPFPK